jgi:hypothetical protein
MRFIVLLPLEWVSIQKLEKVSIQKLENLRSLTLRKQNLCRLRIVPYAVTALRAPLCPAPFTRQALDIGAEFAVQRKGLARL